MHARLFANQKALGPEHLPKHAEAIGLEMSRFRTCFDSRRLSATIRQDIVEGRSLGVSGTPMFFVGMTEPKDGKVKALRVLRGAQDFEAFQNAIESLLTPK
jgi:predicted DsbA family dithiol-disulfide isomerase